MQKAALVQHTHTHLSQQQIQYLRLLALSNVELTSPIDEALTDNPVLEELSTSEDSLDSSDMSAMDAGALRATGSASAQYGASANTSMGNTRATPKADPLYEQLRMLTLTAKEHQIGRYLIGSLDEHGYLRTSVPALCDDLLVSEHVRCTPAEVEDVLVQIQQFEPAGIGARDLQECLRLQLRSLPETPARTHALWMVTHAFQDIARKRYAQLQKSAGISDRELKAALRLITTRNPKPRHFVRTSPVQTIFADFMVQKEKNGQLRAVLRRMPKRIGLNTRYISEITRALKSTPTDAQEKKATLSFIRTKKEEAKQFLTALEQRKITLTRVAQCILDQQRAFIMHRDPRYMRPMRLKDVAEALRMDASTLSRIVNNKYILLPDETSMRLRDFFSQSVDTSQGAVSQKRLHGHLLDLIQAEDKQHPLTDDALQQKLKANGYALARRTVAKYRIQLGIPSARLRRTL